MSRTTGKEETGSTVRGFAQRIRVPAGFLVTPLLLAAARPTSLSLALGATVAGLGLAIRAWASGCLMKNQRLATIGPYAHTRNPLYFGTFILGTGVALAAGSLWFSLLFVGLFLLIYLPVMAAEADTMRDLFPGAYEQYSQRVPIFLPRLTPYKASGYLKDESKEQTRSDKFDSGFQVVLYLRHREYRALLGTVLVFALLIVRWYGLSGS